MRQIFTWWHNQTFGTFLKTLFFGKFVGKDEFGNKYYKSKNDERWVIYNKNIEATKITNDWYLWIHHTVNEIPKNTKKFDWEKKHSQNLTGTADAYKPNRIKKEVEKNYESWKK